MNTHPLVSVVTQVYNTGREVVEAMESVRCSTFTDWEHIIIDDASTDDSVDLIKAYCERHQYPCTLVVHEDNAGITATRREIVSLARGKYIATLSDDLFEPDRLEKDVAFLEGCSDDVCGVFGLALSFRSDRDVKGRVFGRHFVLGQAGVIDPSRFAKALLMCNVVPAVSMTMRSTWASNLPDLDHFLIEDYPQWVHLSNLGGRFGHIPEVTTLYRDSDISVQKTKKSKVALDDLKSKAMLLDSPFLDKREVRIQLWRWFWSQQLVLSSKDKVASLRALRVSGANAGHAARGLALYVRQFLRKHLGRRS